MTAALAPDRKAGPDLKSTEFGTKEELLAGRTLRYEDVVILGKRYRFRELRQSEVEEISAAVVHQESDNEGKLTSRADTRGYKARTLAYAWVQPDTSLTPMLKDPATEWQQINRLTPDVIDAAFQVVDKLSALTRAARDDLGKDSAKATS